MRNMQVGGHCYVITEMIRHCVFKMSKNPCLINQKYRFFQVCCLSFLGDSQPVTSQNKTFLIPFFSFFGITTDFRGNYYQQRCNSSCLIENHCSLAGMYQRRRCVDPQYHLLIAHQFLFISLISFHFISLFLMT